MEAVDATRVQSAFSELLNRVTDEKERILLERNGKAIAAIIPMDDLELLEELVAAEEDRIDRELIEDRLSDPAAERVPHEQVVAETNP